MKQGDRFKVKGGKVHCVGEWYGMSFCYLDSFRTDKPTNAPVTCAHCLRKLAKIKAIATMARAWKI